jgi:mannosyltransferase
MAKQPALIGRPVTLVREPLRTWFALRSSPRRFALASAAVSLYAIVVILAFINSRSVWLDESISVAMASQPFAQMCQMLRHVDAVHALYYSVLHLWLYLGHTAPIVRLLSAICALIAMLAIGTLAALMFEQAVAPSAVAVLATSVYFVFYADEARPTAFTLMTCSLTALCLWRVVERRRLRDIGVCVLCAVLSVYSNVLSTLFIAGLALSLVFLRFDRVTLARLAAACVAGGLALTPLIVLIHDNTLAQVSWIVRSTPRELADFAVNLFGGDAGPGRIGHLAQLFAFAAVIGLMTVGTIVGWRARETRTSVVAALTWLVVPLCLAVIVDQRVQPILVTRYFSYALIPCVLLAGNGVLAVGRRSQPVVAYAIIFALALVSVHSLDSLQREDWRAAVRLVSNDARAGDGIVFWAPLTITPYEFAVHEASIRPVAQIVYPSGPLINEVDYPDPRPGFARTVGLHFKRLWFIDSHDLRSSGAGNPFGGLTRNYSHIQRQRFTGIDVIMYSR